MVSDAVDKIVKQWKRERPDLDASPMAIIGRLSRLAVHLDKAIQKALYPLGITPGEFDVLATLRRSGEPYQLNPTALYQAAMLSSGAMTNRLDHLQKGGYIKRLPDPNDRRGTLVQLTGEGLRLINEAVEVHVNNEQRLLADLTADEKDVLRQILRKWLQTFEEPAESDSTQAAK